MEFGSAVILAGILASIGLYNAHLLALQSNDTVNGLVFNRKLRLRLRLGSSVRLMLLLVRTVRRALRNKLCGCHGESLLVGCRFS